MKSPVCKLALVILLLVVAVGSCRRAGTWLVKPDQPAHADAMVMLMGAISDRVLQVADLYHEKVAGEVWIVEEGTGAMRTLEERGARIRSNTEQVHGALISLGIPAERIVILPGGATSTRMEAEIVRDYLVTRSDTDTLLVVSSSHHTRRAYQIFRAAFHGAGLQVAVRCCPSSYTNFNAQKWWKSRDDIQDVVLEYMKLVNFMLFEKRELRKNPF